MSGLLANVISVSSAVSRTASRPRSRPSPATALRAAPRPSLWMPRKDRHYSVPVFRGPTSWPAHMAAPVRVRRDLELMPEPPKGALVGIILRFGYGGKWTTQRRWPPIAPSGRDSRGLLNELPGAPAPARYARLCGRSRARAFPVIRSCKSSGNLHDYGRQASLLRVATLRESPAEAGRGAVPPLTPQVAGPPQERRAAGCSTCRTPSPLQPPGVSRRGRGSGRRDPRPDRPSGNSVATGEAVRIRAGESLADDRVAPQPRSRVEPGKPPSRRFWPFGGRSRGIRGRRIACNARTRPPEG